MTERKSKAKKAQVTQVEVLGKHPGGRPLLSGAQLQLDPELIKKITTVLKIGSYIEVAAAINGVGYSTIREWVVKSRLHPDSLYGEFARAVEKAISEAETRELALIDTHAQGRDAVYEMEVVLEPFLDSQGNPVFDAKGKAVLRPMKDSRGDPVRQIARDSQGDPILKRSEIKSQWTAAAWKLERRNPSRWGRSESNERDRVLQPEEPEESSGQELIAVTEATIRATLEKIENEY